MAFLDNSGDIILDAVLTDVGRKRMASGDGSFKIAKFAFGDDEINYELYQNANHTNGAHSNGTAYYDLEILQTPVLEAFTGVPMKSFLLTELDNRKQYRSVILLNTKESTTAMPSDVAAFHISTTETTRDLYSSLVGHLDGWDKRASKSYILAHQGLDTDQIPPTAVLDPELRETQYIIRMDNRLGSLFDINGVPVSRSFVDDDNIATYVAALTTSALVRNNDSRDTDTSKQNIRGPRGTILEFKVGASIELQTTTNYWNQLSLETTITDSNSNATVVKYIPSMINVQGATTRYSLDVPVRYIRTKAEF